MPSTNTRFEHSFVILAAAANWKYLSLSSSVELRVMKTSSRLDFRPPFEWCLHTSNIHSTSPFRNVGYTPCTRTPMLHFGGDAFHLCKSRLSALIHVRKSRLLYTCRHILYMYMYNLDGVLRSKRCNRVNGDLRILVPGSSYMYNVKCYVPVYWLIVVSYNTPDQVRGGWTSNF
jgi:hypothetical protein